jgi:hypothetical protein
MLRQHTSLSLLSLLAASTMLSACGSTIVASNTPRTRPADQSRAAQPGSSLPSTFRLPQLSSNPQPAATFPVTLAISSYATGNENAVRDIEQGIDLTSLRSLPHVTNVVVLPSSMPASEVFTTSQAAGADIVVIYQVSRASTHRGTSIPGLGVLTLGAFPNEDEKAYATATASFIDTQTGFVYATAEVTSEATEIQNAWQRTDNTVDLKARRSALRDLLAQCRQTWPQITQRFAQPSN